MTAPKINILIVEDEFITALDIKYFLLKKGYNVIKIVASGEDAIKTALDSETDLVLMDINLKGRVNGLQAAEVILDHKIPVIFVTAQQDESTIQNFKRISANYIFKPYVDHILNKKIEDVLMHS